MVATPGCRRRFFKRNPNGVEAKPHRPSIHHNIELVHHGVPRFGSAPKDDPTGDPETQTLIPTVSSEPGGQRTDQDDNRYAPTQSRLGKPPEI